MIKYLHVDMYSDVLKLKNGIVFCSFVTTKLLLLEQQNLKLEIQNKKSIFINNIQGYINTTLKTIQEQKFNLFLSKALNCGKT